MGEGAGKGSQYGSAEAGPMSQGTQLSPDVGRLPPQCTYEELEYQEQGEFTQGHNTSQLWGCVKSQVSSFLAHGSTFAITPSSLGTQQGQEWFQRA